jgi:hypothetical protein
VFTGTLLLKNLREADKMVKQCQSVCEDFERQTSAKTIEEWRIMKRRWEQDNSMPDPFTLAEKRRLFDLFG